MIDDGSLTVIKYPKEIPKPIVIPFASVVASGFLQVHDNARPHVAGVCRLFVKDEIIDTTEMPPLSPDVNPIE